MEGSRHLGAAVGSPEFITRYLQQKAEAWVQEVSRLTEIAATQPQAAYSVFVHGLKHKRTFLSRVMSDVDAAMAPVEAVVVDDLIPALSGRPVSPVERELLALPCRHGGMGLTKPTSLGSQYLSSRRVSAPISSRIAQQIGALGDSLVEVRAIKRKVASDGRNGSKAEATILAASLEPKMQHVISLASEKGSSSWLTCRPLARHGFSLSKGEFRDAICLRYNWLPPRLPSSCCCGRQFDISHALSCPTGGFPSLRHNEVRDTTAKLLKRVANNVSIEPHLLPLTGEALRYRSAITEDQARLDVAASGVWGGRFERTFIDVRGFNPFASSNRSASLTATYTRHEKAKRRAYEERIRMVEHSSFVPAVFSTTGGMGKASSSLYKRIASLLSEKTGEAYSTTMAWIRCRLSFALLRSSIMCIRGAHRLFGPAVDAGNGSSALVVAEAAIHVH